MALEQDAVAFAAVAAAIVAAAWWRWSRPEDEAAANGARAMLWLLFVSAAGIVLQLTGVV